MSKCIECRACFSLAGVTVRLEEEGAPVRMSETLGDQFRRDSCLAHQTRGGVTQVMAREALNGS
jgi:hypothetical protein